jgi:hypothetical protein
MIERVLEYPSSNVFLEINVNTHNTNLKIKFYGDNLIFYLNPINEGLHIKCELLFTDKEQV